MAEATWGTGQALTVLGSRGLSILALSVDETHKQGSHCGFSDILSGYFKCIRAIASILWGFSIELHQFCASL
ncbi:MAG: hypothetical protein BJG00_016885 [Limnothrix sp. CACIAM 69d]|nr:MAG: hypothetical protein BJG00_016885 [Limnothrix sp. CACIAM 69d]